MPPVSTDLLAWVVVAAFAATALVERYDADLARRAGAGAWALFAVFWLALVPHFAFEQMSIIEGVLSAAAVPASLYTGYLLYRGRTSLLVLTRSIAVMGAIYLPFTTLPWLAVPLVETTTRQVDWIVTQLGYAPTVTVGDAGMRNTFVFHTGGQIYRTSLVLACTGIGSITIFVGLVAAVRAPLDRKLRALAVSAPVIWVLNLARNSFIALAQGKQWFAGLYPDLVMTVFGARSEHLVSFLWADRVVSQSLSVVALVFITWVVVREVPELSVIFEDVIFLATGREYDLQRDLGIGARPDGGERD
ncbi:MAG: archaeosortase A [Haloarculaceae archaeon]